jgi:hypothetical protein
MLNKDNSTTTNTSNESNTIIMQQPQQSLKNDYNQQYINLIQVNNQQQALPSIGCLLNNYNNQQPTTKGFFFSVYLPFLSFFSLSLLCLSVSPFSLSPL